MDVDALFINEGRNDCSSTIVTVRQVARAKRFYSLLLKGRLLVTILAFWRVPHACTTCPRSRCSCVDRSVKMETGTVTAVGPTGNASVIISDIYLMIYHHYLLY